MPPSPPRGEGLLHSVGIGTVRSATRRQLGWLHRIPRGKDMGKYVLGWFLGVPLIVLVAVYFLFN